MFLNGHWNYHNACSTVEGRELKIVIELPMNLEISSSQ